MILFLHIALLFSTLACPAGKKAGRPIVHQRSNDLWRASADKRQQSVEDSALVIRGVTRFAPSSADFCLYTMTQNDSAPTEREIELFQRINSAEEAHMEAAALLHLLSQETVRLHESGETWEDKQAAGWLACGLHLLSSRTIDKLFNQQKA